MRARRAVWPAILLLLAISGQVGSFVFAQAAAAGSPVARNTPDPRLSSYLDEATQAMRRGDNISAELPLRNALKIDPHSILALNDLGIVLARLGRPAEAIPFYQEALRLRPNPATKRNLAIAYFKAEKYASAWGLLRPMATQPSADFQILDLAGLSLFALDRYAEAAEYLERADSQQPSDIETLDMLGKAYLRTRDYKALTSVFARIMKVNPNSAAAHIMMGTAYDQRQERSEAIKEYQQAEQAEPNFMGVHSGLGYLYFRQGENDLAEKEFHEELQRFPDDPVSNCYLGEILLNQTRAAEAKVYFQTALKTNPRYTEALFGMGRTELAMNDPKAAIVALRKAVQIEPDNFQAHYILGTALRDVGQTGEAAREQQLSRAIQEKNRQAAIKKNEAQ